MYLERNYRKRFFEILNDEYDKFLICSDGVTETVSLNDFVNLELDELNYLLENRSKDNFSYIFFEK